MKGFVRGMTVAVAVQLMARAIASADVVFDWNGIALDTVGTQNAFAQARFAAITQLAVFEAVDAITGDYNPYLGTITAPVGASAEAAAAAAAHGVLKSYFPGNASILDAARVSSLAAIPDGPAKDDGIAVGEAAAAAMIADRASDGSSPPQFYAPASANPGEWQATPGCPSAGGVLLQWRDVKPFGILSSDQFRSDPPPSLASNIYAEDYDEVKKVGELNSTDRPSDRANVARYFGIVSAANAWNQAAREVSAAQGNSLSENARAFALLNMAASDGLVSSIETKYHYVFWRPITAIRAGDTDGNRKTAPDPAWAPFITTPCFPSYPSAHTSASYAARKIAENIFGRGRHDITLSHPGIPDVTLHYRKFRRSPTTSTMRACTAESTSASIRRRVHARDAASARTSSRTISGAVATTDDAAKTTNRMLTPATGCTDDDPRKERPTGGVFV